MPGSRERAIASMNRAALTLIDEAMPFGRSLLFANACNCFDDDGELNGLSAGIDTDRSRADGCFTGLAILLMSLFSLEFLRSFFLAGAPSAGELFFRGRPTFGTLDVDGKLPFDWECGGDGCFLIDFSSLSCFSISD